MFLRPLISQTRRAASRSGTTRLAKRHYAASVIKSPYSDVTIPDQTLPQFVWSKCSQWEDLPAVTCGVSGRSYTFGVAKMFTKKFAKGLVDKLPIERGDRVGLLMPNIPEYVVAIHGCIEGGFVPTFANPLFTTSEITRQFANAGVRSIVTIPQLLDNALAVAAKLKNYTYTINAGGETELDRKILGLTEVLSAGSDVTLPQLNPLDIACLPYSSGTTGLPKGVALTHRNLVANMNQGWHPELTEILTTTSVEDQERVLSILPFFHIYGFNSILNACIHHGAHVITMPRFTPEDYIKCLEEYEPTTLFTVPSLVLFMVTHPSVTSRHLKSVRQVICGAAPITENVIQKFCKKTTREDFVFKQGYGMTELSPMTLFIPRKVDLTKNGSVGRLLPLTEARLIDLTDNKDITEANKPGELLIRGPQVMKGYFNNEAATRETVDSDGWLHTGDVAYRDKDDYFYIIDRTKELIKVKGNQVSPTELESLLIEIPGVSDCAVVGVADKAAGELPRAFVVKGPGTRLTVDDIKNYVNPKVAPYKRLDGGIKFIDAIPRNPSGKIMRHQLKTIS